MNSTERRQEHYKIIYVRKVLQGMVPNCGISVSSQKEARMLRMMMVPEVSGSRSSVQTVKDRSLQVEGPMLFNYLPRELRAWDGSLERFKIKLDEYLQHIPDQLEAMWPVPRTDWAGPATQSRTGP